MSRKFKAAIFDFDGVVANSEPFRMKTYEVLFKNEFRIDLNLKIEENEQTHMQVKSFN